MRHDSRHHSMAACPQTYFRHNDVAHLREILEGLLRTAPS